MKKGDDELLQRFLARGDDGAFEELVVRYQNDLLGFFMRLCRNRDLAEELAQDTFVKTYIALKRSKRGARFAPLLYRIAKAAWYSELRKRYRQPKVHGGVSDYKEVIPSGAPDPAEDREEKDFSEALREAMDELPPDSRLVIEMAYYLDMSYKEMAEALEIPIGTVKSRLSNAVRRLRGIMAKRGPEN